MSYVKYKRSSNVGCFNLCAGATKFEDASDEGIHATLNHRLVYPKSISELSSSSNIVVDNSPFFNTGLNGLLVPPFIPSECSPADTLSKRVCSLSKGSFSLTFCACRLERSARYEATLLGCSSCTLSSPRMKTNNLVE